MIVGEGGVDPEYFLRKMEWWEVQHYIFGVRRRDRTIWSAIRWHGWLISNIMGGKIKSPDEMMEFPWEKEPVDEEEEEKKMEKLLADCRRWNEQH